MFWNRDHGSTATLPSSPDRSDRRHLRALIDQATRDSLDESDEHASLLSTVREEVVCPFLAQLNGEEVECIRLEFPRNGYGLNAVCKAEGTTVSVDISKLQWLEPLPKGHQWIEAYFAWRDLIG
jgi:hypothetical protein